MIPTETAFTESQHEMDQSLPYKNLQRVTASQSEDINLDHVTVKIYQRAEDKPLDMNLAVSYTISNIPPIPAGLVKFAHAMAVVDNVFVTVTTMIYDTKDAFMNKPSRRHFHLTGRQWPRTGSKRASFPEDHRRNYGQVV